VKEFKLQINEAQLFKEVEANFREKTLSTMRGQLNEMFSEPRAYRPGDKGGTAWQLIQERICDKLLDENTQKIMNAYFEENWERLLKEEMEKAIRKAAKHKANQIAFAQSGLKNPRENKFDHMFDSQHMETGA